MLDQVRLQATLDAIADLFASCDSPDDEILAAEQIHLFTALVRTGAVIEPADLQPALQAMWERAPEAPFPDLSDPDVFDVLDAADPPAGSPRRGRVYLVVDNTKGPSEDSSGQLPGPPVDRHAAPAVGESSAPPTGAP